MKSIKLNLYMSLERFSGENQVGIKIALLVSSKDLPTN